MNIVLIKTRWTDNIMHRSIPNYSGNNHGRNILSYNSLAMYWCTKLKIHIMLALANYCCCATTHTQLLLSYAHFN